MNDLVIEIIFLALLTIGFIIVLFYLLYYLNKLKKSSKKLKELCYKEGEVTKEDLCELIKTIP